MKYERIQEVLTNNKRQKTKRKKGIIENNKKQ